MKVTNRFTHGLMGVQVTKTLYYFGNKSKSSARFSTLKKLSCMAEFFDFNLFSENFSGRI